MTPGKPTKSELRIAHLVSQDMSDKMIAGQLGLSPKTVKVHIYSLLSKLGVRSRIGIALWWTANHG